MLWMVHNRFNNLSNWTLQTQIILKIISCFKFVDLSCTTCLEVFELTTITTLLVLSSDLHVTSSIIVRGPCELLGNSECVTADDFKAHSSVSVIPPTLLRCGETRRASEVYTEYYRNFIQTWFSMEHGEPNQCGWFWTIFYTERIISIFHPY